MYLILQQDTADDYVLATGETHPVREFVEKSFARLDIKIRWEGKGVDEKGIDEATGKVLIEVDPKYFRPTEVDLLLGDPSKAKKELGWEPTYSFEELVHEMVDADLALFKRDKYLLEGGHKIYHQKE
jgi:GDPmannose 4,6-dehydratase